MNEELIQFIDDAIVDLSSRKLEDTSVIIDLLLDIRSMLPERELAETLS